MKTRTIKSIIESNEGKPEFNKKEIQKRMLLEVLTSMTDAGEPYQIDDYNREVLQNLTKYFSNDSDGPYPLTKGIYLWGKVGTGKTILLKAFQILAREFHGPKPFKFRNSLELAEQYSMSGSEIYKEFEKADLCIDDLGNEPMEVNYYGTRLPFMPFFIQNRYQKWQFAGLRTHYTSNFDLAWVETNYGKREASRLEQACTVIELKAKEDRRKRG